MLTLIVCLSGIVHELCGNRIGIRSSDLEESFSKTVEGLKMVMKGSSRLAIPAALFALTAAFDHFTPDNLQLQVSPTRYNNLHCCGFLLLEGTI